MKKVSLHNSSYCKQVLYPGSAVIALSVTDYVYCNNIIDQVTGAPTFETRTL